MIPWSPLPCAKTFTGSLLMWCLQNRKRRVTQIVLLCALFVIVPAVVHAASPPFEAGLGVRDITPEVGYPCYRGESTGVTYSLYAKALVLRQGDESAALILCDIIGAPRALSARIRKQVSTETGIPFEHVSVAATHTHTGPDYFEELRQYADAEAAGDLTEELEQGYVARLIEQAAGAALDAHNALAPVHVDTLSAEEDGVSFNRRFLLTDGRVRMNPGRNNPDAVRPTGPIDPEVLTVLFRGADGQPLGGLANFANHLDTVGGTEFHPDYPHYLAQSLREEFGEAFISIFGTGPCGNLNHVDVKGGERLTTRDIGETLGAAIRANLDNRSEQDATLGAMSRTVFWPMQDFTEDELAWARNYQAGGLYAERAFLQRRRALKILSLNAARKNKGIEPGPTGASRAFHDIHQPAIPPGASGEPWILPVEVHAFRISADTAIVTMPGELFVELGLDLKERSPFRHTLVIELANAHIAYVPTEEGFRHGDYEAVNSRLAPGGGEAMVDAAVEMLNALHKQVTAAR